MPFLVEDRKVTHYLLVDPSKSRFFQNAGYSLAAWWVLRDDLLQHPLIATFEGFVPQSRGLKAKYRCAMPLAPNGRLYCVRSVWQQQPADIWRFVTAYPR